MARTNQMKARPMRAERRPKRCADLWAVLWILVFVPSNTTGIPAQKASVANSAPISRAFSPGATNPELVAQLSHSGMVMSAVISSDGRYVLTTGGDRAPKLWEMATNRVIRQFNGHTDVVKSAVFSSDGRYVLTASTDHTARLWEMATGKEIRQFTGHASWVHSAVFSPDGRSVLTASRDHTARLWEAVTGKEIRQFEGHRTSQSLNPQRGEQVNEKDTSL